MVYTIKPRFSSEVKCDSMSQPNNYVNSYLTSTIVAPLFPPLVVYRSHPVETHYFPFTRENKWEVHLHTHGWAPYIRTDLPPSGLEFDIYSSGVSGCSSDLVGFDLRIDWRATFGRIGPRYFTTILTWVLAVVSIIVYQTWTTYERGGE
jgi:GPI inositol-deacylase